MIITIPDDYQDLNQPHIESSFKELSLAVSRLEVTIQHKLTLGEDDAERLECMELCFYDLSGALVQFQVKPYVGSKDFFNYLKTQYIPPYLHDKVVLMMKYKHKNNGSPPSIDEPSMDFPNLKLEWSYANTCKSTVVEDKLSDYVFSFKIELECQMSTISNDLKEKFKTWDAFYFICTPHETFEQIKNRMAHTFKRDNEFPLLEFKFASPASSSSGVIMNQTLLQCINQFDDRNNLFVTLTGEETRVHVSSPNTNSAKKIVIKTFTGSQPYEYMVADSTTVLRIKYLIERDQGIPCDQQRLIFDGKQLEDQKTVLDCKIPHLACILLALRLRGGMFANLSGRNGYKPIYYLDSSVSMLKDYIGICKTWNEVSSKTLSLIECENLLLKIRTALENLKSSADQGGLMFEKNHSCAVPPKPKFLNSRSSFYFINCSVSKHQDKKRELPSSSSSSSASPKKQKTQDADDEKYCFSSSSSF
jgi:hypothetical protein